MSKKIHSAATTRAGRSSILKPGFELSCLVGLVLNLSLLVFATATFAQEKMRPAVASIPQDLPPLPLPTGDEKPLLIHSGNIAIFHEIVLSTLAPLVKNRLLTLPTYSRLDFPWRGPLAAAKSNVTRNAETLKSIIFRTSGTPRLVNGFELAWFGANQSEPQRTASGLIYSEYYPASATQASLLGPALESRTVFRLLSPAVVFGFSIFNFRFDSAREDEIFISSPVTGKTRRVFNSNISDPILNSNLTPQDFYVWFNKPTETTIKFIDERTLLVPFARLKPYKLIPETAPEEAAGTSTAASNTLPPAAQGVFLVERPELTVDGSTRIAHLNYQSKRYPEQAAWMPTAAFYVPRKVYIYEIIPEDGFLLTGRQVLVVDEESGLPVYKIVYARDGTYEKTVIGIWGLVNATVANSSTVRQNFLAQLIVIDSNLEKVTTLTNQIVKVFTAEASSTEDDSSANEASQLFAFKAE
ncbi:hypothetical protein JNK13_08130 [bacterium]|nr:hypothetical protein [bacterium]